MITKTKKSVSLSNTLLKEIAIYSTDSSVSEFIENVLTYYLNELKKTAQRQRDMEIINANAKRFNKEAIENLEFQALI